MWQEWLNVMYQWKDSIVELVTTDYEYDGADDFLIL